MKLKRSKKIILTVIMIAVMLFAFSNTTVFGAINDDYKGSDSVTDQNLEQAFNDSSLLGLLARLIYAVGQFLEWILGTIFHLLTGSSDFAWADKIVFNSVPLLDVNFINPDGQSFVGNPNIKIVLKDLYATILSLAVSFFGIVVLITAIKLVISTIASDKAKYKQAIIDWTIGFVLLFCMHYFISFIFYLNEQLVVVASNIVTVQLNNKPAIAQAKSSELATTLIDSMGSSTYNGKSIKNILNENKSILEVYINLSSDDGSKGIHEMIMKEQVGFGMDKAISDDEQKQNLAMIITWAASENVSVSRLQEIRRKEIFGVRYSGVFYGQAITATNLNNIFGDQATAVNAMQQYGYKKKSDINNFIDTTTGDVEKQNSMSNNEYLYMSSGTGEIAKEASVWRDLNTVYCEYHWTDVIDDLIKLKSASKTSTGTYKEGAGKSSRLIADLASYFKYNAAEKNFRDTNKTGLKETGNINIQNMIMYAILVAQSLILFISYVKRLFYVVMLAMIAPIVVVVDFFQKFGK